MLNMLFQPHCLLCGQPCLRTDPMLCNVCHGDIDQYPKSTDILLAMPKITSQIKVSALDGLCAVGAYQFPLNIMIQQLKFHHQMTMARPLGQLLASQVKSQLWPKQMHHCAIPLHKFRHWWRGYNQADLIAQQLRKAQACSYSTIPLRRVRRTQPQTHLTAQQRIANVANAFHCEANLDGENILLIDDVLTTGQTLNQAATCLKACGAKHVYAAVVAIAE